MGLVRASDDSCNNALIRRCSRELPVEEIRRDRLVVVAHRRAFEAFPLAVMSRRKVK